MLSIVVSGHLTALWARAPFGILIEHLWGWRSVFAVLAGLGGVFAIVNFKIWERVFVSLTTRKNVPTGNLLRILRSVSVTTGWAISMYALYVYLGAALHFENEFCSSDVALAVTFYGIGAVLGSITRGSVMAWNNTALYVGITLGSMLGGFVITNWGYRVLPFVCSGVAVVSFILSCQRQKGDPSQGEGSPLSKI